MLLNHGSRSASPRNDADRRDLNIAMDVTVNTQLVSAFGFRRECLDERIARLGCFKDTVFGHDHDVRFNHFEHIYRQLGGVDTEECELWCFDDHTGLDDIPEELLEEVSERAGRRMSDEEVEEINEVLDDSTAGDFTPMAIRVMKPRNVEVNTKWAEIIEDWVRRNKPVDEFEERWDRTPRRLQSVQGGLSVPWEKPVEDFDMPRVTFFVDTSGSCRKYARRFMDCVDSIPHHLFDVDLYCFDTQPYRIDLDERKLTGFGGTSFHPLEYELKKQARQGSEYPQGVFILTDGWGNPVEPAYPERWHWFLTENGTDKYIHRDSKQYRLAEFEGGG